MDQQLTLTLSLKDDVDEEQLDRLTHLLRDEIAELGVEQIQLVRGDEAPHRGKGDPITIGGLVVTLASTGVLTALIQLLKTWAQRGDARVVRVKTKVGNEEVEVEYRSGKASAEETGGVVARIVGLLRQEHGPSGRRGTPNGRRG
jgi:hypothetical protein